MTKESPKLKSSNGEGWVVGLGASAGGLEALSTFIANLPESFGGTLIVAQHLAPHAKSMMVELLQRHSRLSVVAAKDGVTIESRRIYVVPPNHDIDIRDQKIYLTVAGSETRPKPSVDEFFESLARAFGDRAVGIVLSGTGTDGSEGIQAIKAVGGLTLAQDDMSAKYDGMPRSAVNTGNVDTILPPDQMARDLGRFLQDHEAHLKANRLDDRGLKKILHFLREKTGTDFQRYKPSTVYRRVAKRMLMQGEDSVDAYYEYLLNSPQEQQELAQEMLVSVTSFFRDPDSFASLDPLIEKIVSSKKSGDEIRVWVAGCATGEEAYTLAILFLEKLDEFRRHVALKIFASDLDQEAILEARNGAYGEKDIAKVPEKYREKFFELHDDVYYVSKRLRDVVVFARQDLTQNPPFVKLDMVSCRNVLIYFNLELQKKVIEVFHYALNPNGVLFLGSAETPSVAASLFDTYDRKTKVFIKLNVPSRNVPSSRASPMMPVPQIERKRLANGPTLAELAYLRLINGYGLSGVVVDDECNILQILGDVSPYLGFFTPQADFRLTNLLPKGIGVEIPILLRKSAKDGGVHRSRLYKKPKNAVGPAFYVVVRRLEENEDNRHVFVVNFEPKRDLPKGETKSVVLDGELPSRVHELEQELFSTREHLHTVIEELGVSNEELQSLNEELSSTNEELQASSEELETANEELQSSNEELTTMNEELGNKQAELRHANMSLENVQNSIGSPLVIVDSDRRVVRYNPEALKVFGLAPSDIGRDITRVSSNFEIENFGPVLSSVIDRAKTAEILVEIGSAVYQLRILPCYDELESVTGAILIFIDNTAVLRSQKRIESSEHRLLAILNGSESMVFLKDSMGRYILVNRSFCEFFKMREKDVIGKTDRELFSERIAVPFREADLEVFVKRTSFKTQEEIQGPDGKTHTFLSSRFPLIDGDGTNPYAVGTVAVDITTQVKTQSELHKSESRYRAIANDQAVFVCRFKPDGTITYANAPFAAQFGGTEEQNIGKTFQRIIAEPDRATVARELGVITFHHPIVQVEHRVAGSGPQYRWVRWIHRGIFNENQEISEYQAVGFDVTETRKQTDQLIERNTIYSSVFDHTVDFLSVFRVEGTEFILESFNRSAAKVMGHAYSQLVGRNLREFIDTGKLEEVLGHYEKCVRFKKAEVFDEHFETPGGIRYYSTTLVPIPGPDGAVERVAAISRDVSFHKRTELDLRKAKEEADVANKSKSDFLASMSHELRTPLNVVLGMAQLLADSALDKEQMSFVGSIYRSGHLLLTLIEDVLDVAKIEAGKIKLEAVTFNPVEVTHEVLDLFKMQAREKGVELKADIEPEASVFVIGDPVRLRQVLMNLVSNALKFTDKGSVTIHVRSDHSEGLASPGEPDWRGFSFRVEDTGIGIPEAAHAKLFQRFSQVDSGNSRKYGGTGLGLMISKNLVALMGGTIGVESQRGQGSTFWVKIRLPMAQRQESVSSFVSPRFNRDLPKNGISRPMKILAVDDNPDSRTLIGLFLQRLGHEADLAAGGAEALAKLHQDAFDLILMDVQMPDMDGYETTAKIRELDQVRAGTPVVALTANAMSGDAERAFDAGMDDYLTKPVDISALKSLIEKWSARVGDSGGRSV